MWLRGLLAGLALAGSTVIAVAQTLPPATESDLLVPPDLRAGAHAAPTPTRMPHRTAARHGTVPDAAEAGVTPKRPRAPSEHPVDVGVVMRGGSATPRLYSPDGTTQAARESGNAFGAGMRIGF